MRCISDNGVDDPQRLRDRVNVVNTEDRSSAQYSGNDACKSTGVAFRWIRNAERIANDGLSRDRQQNRPSETLGISDPVERDAGTLACVVAGVLRGASIFRVHNVHAVSQALRVLYPIVGA